MDTLSQVVQLFLLMLCGYAAVKLRWIGDQGIGGLNALVLNFSLPCLTIAKLQQRADPALLGDLTTVFVLGGLSMIVSGLLAWFAVYRREQPTRKAVLTSMCMFSNAGFMGFPVLSAAFGADKLIYGVIYVAVFNLLNWSIGVVLFDPSALSWKRLLRVPCLTASIVGIILFIGNIRLPQMLTGAMSLMGDTTTPLAMFIVGTRLTQLKLSDMRDGPLLLACVLRLLCFPLMVYGLTGLLGVGWMPRAVVTLCTAMPCAAGLVIQAETYRGDGALASRGVAISTALSIGTIPLMLLLLIQ